METFWGMPSLASDHGGEVDRMLWLIHGLMFALLIGWGVFYIVALARFRRARHPKASYEGIRGRWAAWIEGVVVAVKAALLVGLAVPVWATAVRALPGPEEDPVEVRVLAQQFVWNVHYPGSDGVFGQTRPELIDSGAGNPIGLDRGDPYAGDDIVKINWLHVPVGRPVVVHLTSLDVVHGFSLPEFRVKQDAIPGMSVSVTFTPTKTTEQFREELRAEARAKLGDDPQALAERLDAIEDRHFEIKCTQLCGMGHYNMRGFLKVHSEESYEAWLGEQADHAPEEVDEFWL